jgi:hypothetical protein
MRRDKYQVVSSPELDGGCAVRQFSFEEDASYHPAGLDKEKLLKGKNLGNSRCDLIIAVKAALEPAVTRER